MYSCFSEQGETLLPDQIELQEITGAQLEPNIFLDSCVCLHIIKVIDYGKKATNVDLNRIIQLKEYLHTHSIKITPFFGLLELCIKDGQIDKEKLEDFKNRIDFFEQMPLKYFKNFDYNYRKNYVVFKRIDNLPNIYPAIEPQLKNTYCALLKIRSIALRNITKSAAISNINSFFEWMVNDLDIIRGTEYQLALNIFGGNTEFRKMIGLDSRGADAKKKLKGSTWDIFHGKNVSNSFRLFDMLGRSFKPYFLTSDANLFKIISQISLTLIKDGGENFMSSFIANSKLAFPNYNMDFVEQQNEKMIKVFVDRRNKEYDYDPQKINRLIEELELENYLL
ncbi:hypothetical protein [Mucilaginibacter sp.]|uniref:hypothetical protein n=1 Tax=Mucilaginibacter sp. TaxID=1882438 RepID=UPI002633F869|nr:hypothetical protein [Mucilaginibacter sp.]MDB4925942.1 hypothetical protein [Mucilaginibacter sp.]